MSDEQNAVEAARLGQGIADARDAAAGAAELVAHARRILADLERGATGVAISVGPLKIGNFTIGPIPIHFKLEPSKGTP